jgi:hypothetical protein
MASRRYVREENDRTQQTILSNSNNTFEGVPGRGRSRGRFSGRSRGRFASSSLVRVSHQNKWIRTSTDASVNDAEVTSRKLKLDDTSICRDVELPVDNGKASLAESKLESEDKALISNSFERRGEHKLILKKDDTVDIKCVNKNGPLQKPLVSSALTLSNKHGNPESLERRGKNKLVLKNLHPLNLESRETNASKDSREHHLIGTNAPYTWSRQPNLQFSGEKRDATTVKDGDFGRKRKHPNSLYKSSAKGSRRICLNANDEINDVSTTGFSNDEYAGESKYEIEDMSVNNSKALSNKTLTDFAYRDTCNTSRRGKSKTANIGLVRVVPKNPSATAICPTFRKGLPCNNPKCTLRHDVSSEASRPICVFFQRNGMCSKGDACMFSHVKVRWDAEVCPMFERLGYCEDSSCVLKHVVARKTKDDKGNLIPKPP